MNIFTALSSRGDNKLRETNLSAIFAYFLDPTQDHGLSVSFLQEFLKLAKIELPRGVNLHKTYVETEQPQDDNQGKMNLDIVAELRDNEDGTLRVIVVENKIKTGAANAKQLARYYDAKQNESGGESITMIFLTPAAKTTEMNREYENLELPEISACKDGDNKTWLNWTGNEFGIQTMLRDILRAESAGEISPINEYAKHTLKAFAVHLDTLLPASSSGELRTAADYDVVDSESVQISNGQYEGKYKIVKNIKGGVYVRKEDGEKVTAKPILRAIIKQENLDVPLKGENTYVQGKKVMQQLREKGAA